MRDMRKLIAPVLAASLASGCTILVPALTSPSKPASQSAAKHAPDNTAAAVFGFFLDATVITVVLVSASGFQPGD
jgi:hypothetical protein